MTSRPVICTVDGCELPFAEIVPHVGLSIRSRHHGEQHINIVTPELLSELMCAGYEWYAKGEDVYHNCCAWGQRRAAVKIGSTRWRCVHCGKEWDARGL